MRRSDPEYIKQYYHARKAADPDYYRLYSSRKYYQKQLRILDENDHERREKIANKLNEINAKLETIKQSRTRYVKWQTAHTDSSEESAENSDSAASPMESGNNETVEIDI